MACRSGAAGHAPSGRVQAHLQHLYGRGSTDRCSPASADVRGSILIRTGSPFPLAIRAACAVFSAAASAAPLPGGTRSRTRSQLAPTGASHGLRGRPGSAAGTGTGPSTSASGGSSAAARKAASASGGPVTAAIRETGGKPSSARSASSRRAWPTGSQRTSAWTGRSVGSATMTTVPPSGCPLTSEAAAVQRRSASSPARRSGRPSIAQPSSSSAAA